MLIVATGVFGQGTPAEGEQTLTVSGKVWPRWQLDRWHEAYKTTGVILSRCKPTIYIAGIAAGSPSEVAGLKTNDTVLLVGTNQASRMSLGEIDRAMLGDAGKTVDLVIRRPGESSDRRITLTIQAMTFEELKKKESNKAAQAIGAPAPLPGR
jgi:C-terminal processing protease CtpA/Prc